MRKGLFAVAIVAVVLLSFGGAMVIGGTAELEGPKPCAAHDPDCNGLVGKGTASSFCALHDPDCNRIP